MNKQDLEEALSKELEEGDMKMPTPANIVRDMLPPKHEIRVTARRDPIVEETHRIRKVVQEVDDRYDEYLSRIPKRREE